MRFYKLTILFIVILFSLVMIGCEQTEASGKTTFEIVQDKLNDVVHTNAEGLTIEQQNILDRQKMDNMVGSIKHLYVISAFTGDVIDYSTIKGKVTSSGKRLQPYTSSGYYSGSSIGNGSYSTVTVGNNKYDTNEIRQADGTYGSSIEYLYWWDVKGNYHQLYPGSAIIRISDTPLVFNKAIQNVDK